VAEVRFALDESHAGHTGTLDPGATGLLVIALGKACRLMPFMEGHDKEYEFTVRLGVRTETDDAAGKILEERDASGVTRARLDEALKSFAGPIRQRPPDFSAVKVEGRRAYQLARRGRKPDLTERDVVIQAMEVVRFAAPRIDLRVRCSKGTYVRSIARDLGDALGVGGSVEALRRTVAGPFRVTDAVRLGDASAGQLKAAVRPPDVGIGHLPRIDVDPDGAAKFRCGQVLQLPLADPAARVYHDGRLIGIAEPREGLLKAHLVIA